MLSLQKGKYLASLDKSMSDGHIVVSMTSYPLAERYEELHYHENPHISLVLAGGSLEKRKNLAVERLPGKITFYRSGEYHQSTSILDNSRHINLELDQPFLMEYGINESEMAHAIERTPEGKFFLLRVYGEMIADDDQSSLSVSMLLLDLLQQASNSLDGKKHYSWVSDIEEVLRGNWDRRLSLNALSSIAKVHPVTLSRQFHKYHSCTLGEYLRKLKIEKALTLIKTSRQSLTEIVYECGFADQSHFTRTFKCLTGLLPHAYQKL